MTWNTYLKGQGGVRSAPLRTTWGRVANALVPRYNVTSDPGGTNEIIVETLGAVSSDAASIAKYIRRERVLANVGESDSTAAGNKADAELASSKDFQQELDTLVVTQVWDSNGVSQSLCKVRAGDVIKIRDLIPTSVGLASVDLDSLRTFVIEEVTCNHSRGEITIRPDRSSKSLAALLSRAHIIT